MLFSISRGNVADVSPDQRRLAYVIADTEAAYEAKLDCVFTDGNAADPDRRRRRMAEFLIHEEAPLGIVRGIAVYDQAMREEAVAIVSGILPVAIRPGWYF